MKNQYETLRKMVLTLSLRSQQFILFIERGMIGWLETMSDYFIFSLPKEEEPSLKVNYLPDTLQSQTTNILSDMVFQCLAKTNKDIQ